MRSVSIKFDNQVFLDLASLEKLFRTMGSRSTKSCDRCNNQKPHKRGRLPTRLNTLCGNCLQAVKSKTSSVIDLSDVR